MGRTAALICALALLMAPSFAAAAGEGEQPAAPAAAEPAEEPGSGETEEPAAETPGSGETEEPGAETPAEPEEPEPGVVTEPKPKRGKVSVSLKGLSKGKLRFGKRMTVAATLAPKLRGEALRFVLKRGKKTVARRKISVGRRGKAKWRLRPYKPGAYRVVVRHLGSTRIGPAKDSSKRFGIRYSSLAQGNFGRDVALLNKGLRKLAFVTSKGRTFSAATGRAVLAYRKANGMARTEVASTKVVRRIAAGKGKVKLRYPKAGRHVEADISRQILILANKGKAVRVYHTSSGASSTPTILGKYRFYMYQPGYNNVGMYYSAYFIRGYAIHGYKSVPTYPASHGCLRVPIPDARDIYNWVDIGMRIFTYR